MDKYHLLVYLNAPFVIYGFIKAFSMYRKGTVKRFGLTLRLGFWLTIALGLLFAKELYAELARRGLTDTTPLSLADVVLVTGVIFCLFLIMRLYTKADMLERRVADLQERVSVELSVRRK